MVIAARISIQARDCASCAVTYSKPAAGGGAVAEVGADDRRVDGGRGHVLLTRTRSGPLTADRSPGISGMSICAISAM
ncbi:hypothetical protein Ga0074812_13128 [Parafrankia irregularis]|uniref:Uncharacterized protein n=1 Tax=Parafrankia irregularis TaxID=795642 RepID=A0A0S4QXF1_9ACTN|nr:MULTISPECIES: hypothetical protein [Parafrankia]MBE3200324.1 hypothetical protein [Parafrankia sp. CH37]CUU59730.1 hypothetical protein Ga0074812_13128 [Parafrankia irregularis]